MGEGPTRRAFGAALTAAAASPRPLAGQPAPRPPLVGILWHAGSAEEEEPYRAPLMEGFAELGYVAGRTVVFDERYADEVPERFERNARDLAAAGPDVIVAVSIPSALAAQRATRTIPVVFLPPPDPVGLGLVASLSRPGGNLTGLSSMAEDLAAKRVHLLKETLPALDRFALMVERDWARVLDDTRRAAAALGLAVEPFEVRTAEQLEPAMAGMAGRGHGAVLIPQTGPLAFAQKRRVAALALAHRLPALGPSDLFTRDGALMSYGPLWRPLFRRVAWYVNRILKGARPADLPVEQPARLELTVNLRTAAALGIEVPPSVLARADALID